MSECNCYHGMDCSKIAVCAAEAMVENAVEELEGQLEEHMEISVEAEQNYFHIKAQLDAVRGLPEKRVGVLHGKYQKGYRHGWNAFYDKLQQALESKPG